MEKGGCKAPEEPHSGGENCGENAGGKRPLKRRCIGHNAGHAAPRMRRTMAALEGQESEVIRRPWKAKDAKRRGRRIGGRSGGLQRRIATAFPRPQGWGCGAGDAAQNGHLGRPWMRADSEAPAGQGCRNAGGGELANAAAECNADCIGILVPQCWNGGAKTQHDVVLSAGRDWSERRRSLASSWRTQRRGAGWR